MAVPSSNIRYTRIETEVNEAIEAHPSIHDELIRYSWSRYQSEDPDGGTYYQGLSHHSLCKTAILYKGFIGISDPFAHSTHGGYSIQDMGGYDWENHGTTLADWDATPHFSGGDTGSYDSDIAGGSYDDGLTLSLASGPFHVTSEGNSRYVISPCRAHTEIQTDYNYNGGKLHIMVSNVREFSNRTYPGSGFTRSITHKFVVDIGNVQYIRSMRSRWRVENYYASLDDSHGVVLAMTEKNGSNPASYEYKHGETVASNGVREGNQGEWTGQVHDITPKTMVPQDSWQYGAHGTSDFAGEEFGSGTRCVSAFGVYQRGSNGNFKTALVRLNSGGLYEYQLRFYHDAATRDYTVLNIQAEYKGSSNSARRLIRAKALWG